MSSDCSSEEAKNKESQLAGQKKKKLPLEISCSACLQPTVMIRISSINYF